MMTKKKKWRDSLVLWWEWHQGNLKGLIFILFAMALFFYLFLFFPRVMRDQQKRRFDAVEQTVILSKEEIKELSQSELGNHLLLIGYKIAYSFAYRGQSYEKQEYIYFRTLKKAERKKLRDLEVGDNVQVLFQKQNPKASMIDFSSLNQGN